MQCFAPFRITALRLLGVLWLLFSISVIQATTPCVGIGASFRYQELRAQVAVLVDTQRQFDLEQAVTLFERGMARSLDRFRPAGKFRRGLYAYWLQFRVQNDRPDTLRLLVRRDYLTGAWAFRSDGTRTPLEVYNRQTEPARSLWVPRFELFFDTLPPGAVVTYYCRLEEYGIDAGLRPELWDLDHYNGRAAERARAFTRAEGLYMGCLLTVALFGLGLLLTRRQRVYFWYTVYQGLILLYFWRTLEGGNPTFFFIADYLPWTQTKVALAMLTYLAYLKFVDAFVNDRGQAPWMTRLVRIASVALLGYIGFDAVLLLLGLEHTSWVLYYLLRIVFFSIGLVFLGRLLRLLAPRELSKRNGSGDYFRPAWYVLMGSMVLLLSNILSVVLSYSVPNNLTNFGFDLTLIPARAGILLEALFFLQGLMSRESVWLKERIDFNRALVMELEQRSRLEAQRRDELKDQLSQVEAELKAKSSALLLSREQEMRWRRDRAADQLQLRVLHYGFIAELAGARLDELRGVLRQEGVGQADDQLTRFGSLTRDLLTCLKLPGLSMREEYDLLERIVHFRGMDVELRGRPRVAQWVIPPLLLVSLVHQSRESSDKKAALRLEIEEEGNQCTCCLRGLGAGAFADPDLVRVWVDAQERIRHFAQIDRQHWMLETDGDGWRLRCVYPPAAVSPNGVVVGPEGAMEE